MPYRFKIDEPVNKGFQRIAREQLEAALSELAAPQIAATGVHECRKALKRMRALVLLAAGSLKKGEARRRTKALGKVARLLATKRDQAVRLATLGKLMSDSGPDGALVLAPLKAHLTRTLGDGAPHLDAGSAGRAHELLLREARKFSRLRLRRRGFAALESGLEKSYRRARKALTDAYCEPSDESFHSLRKAVQWHWRQMSLLARAWPEEFAVRVDAARELSQILGDDHDLAMLIEATLAADDITAEHKEAIAGLCLGRQAALRAAAEHRAQRLLAEKPKAFIGRIGGYWEFGRIVPLPEVAGTGHRSAKVLRADAQTGSQPATQDAAPSSAKPRLAPKPASSTPSQRRA
jgi:CHAD domain-containing protein